jgi:hypothetical protein
MKSAEIMALTRPVSEPMRGLWSFEDDSCLR